MSPAPRARTATVVATVVGTLAFALGVGAGVVIVFATGAGTTGRSVAVPSVRPTTPAAVPSRSATASLTLDAACMRALSAARTVSADLNSAAVAARTLNAAELDAIVRQLQVISPELRGDLSACRAVVQPPPGGVPASPSPVALTPTPSASVAG